MTPEEIIALSIFENELLDIVYHQEEMTTSDLQGAIQAQVYLIYRLGKDKNDQK